MSPVLSVATAVALCCYGVASWLALYRLFRGPRAQDRVLAFDFLSLQGLLVILVLGVRYQTSAWFEAALILAVLGFMSTAAMAKFLLRGEVIE